MTVREACARIAERLRATFTADRDRRGITRDGAFAAQEVADAIRASAPKRTTARRKGRS